MADLPNIKPLLQHIEEFYPNYLFVGIDSEGEPTIINYANTSAGYKAIQGFTDDWLKSKQIENRLVYRRNGPEDINAL